MAAINTVSSGSPAGAGSSRTAADVPFGVNEMRLNGQQWLVVMALLLLCALALPALWKQWEVFNPGPDYRIPYALSRDYWLYQRRLEHIADPAAIVVLGDSVVWGEYVRADGTFSHYLNQQDHGSARFVNAGVNGLFPLAMEGLVAHYGGALRNRKVILHCNLLWMTSPKADLSSPEEATFNHPRLVPQFFPRLACYRADAAERLSALLEQRVGLLAWGGHLQSAYLGQQSLPQWTLQDDGGTPPNFPNAWRNPLATSNAGPLVEAAADPQRGPNSPRHKPWNAAGAEPAPFEWVPLAASQQWLAFQRVVDLLRARGNDVLVIVGPFNEHMVAPDQRPDYVALRTGVAAWLAVHHVVTLVPDTLPSDLYADASHPLTQGYALLARQVWQQREFGRWLKGETSAGK